MKPYGVPRVKDIECPDKADIMFYAIAGHKERARTSKKWQSSRRVWKKKERANIKAQIGKLF